MPKYPATRALLAAINLTTRQAPAIFALLRGPNQTEELPSRTTVLFLLQSLTAVNTGIVGSIAIVTVEDRP
jgi:hypothetical protein